jgi:hypothetical protein
MDNVTKFIEQLLEEKGLAELDPEVRTELVEDLSSRFTQFLNTRLIDTLIDDEKLELSKLVDEQPPDMDKIQKYIAEKIPDTITITANAMKEFRGLYLGEQA